MGERKRERERERERDHHARRQGKASSAGVGEATARAAATAGGRAEADAGPPLRAAPGQQRRTLLPLPNPGSVPLRSVKGALGDGEDSRPGITTCVEKREQQLVSCSREERHEVAKCWG